MKLQLRFAQPEDAAVLLEIYREQAEALLEAGVDLFAVETMMGVTECMAAIEAIRSLCETPILCTLSVYSDGKCYFDTAKRFADCVDTSVRHLVNLMTYNANKEEFHLPGSKCNVTDKDFEKLLAEYNQENNEENHILHFDVQ